MKRIRIEKAKLIQRVYRGFHVRITLRRIKEQSKYINYYYYYIYRFKDDEEYPEFNFDEFMDDILRSKPTPSHKIQPDIIEEEEEDKVILGSTEKLPSVNFNSIRSPLKATQPVYISPKSSALPPLNLETMNNVGGRSNSAPDSVDKISEPASTISKLVFIYKLDIIIFIY